MKNGKMLSLLLTGAMTAALLAVPAQAAEAPPTIRAGSYKGTTLAAGETSGLILYPGDTGYAVVSDDPTVISVTKVLGRWTATAQSPGTATVTVTAPDGRTSAIVFTVGGDAPAREDHPAPDGNIALCQELIRLVNQTRRENGAAELSANDTLMTAAQACSDKLYSWHHNREECEAVAASGYRRGPDGKPEIDPEEAETVRMIYARYLEGHSLGDIQRELIEKNIPTAEGIQGWSRQVIQNILTSEKYIGDGLRQKTYTTGPIGNKKTVKNNGELPMYYAKNNHPAIIPRDIFYRVKEEMSRRTSKRKVMQKTAKTEQGKYSAKYALSELLICGECGTPYKRCTWARNGKKRIVWRCVSRLEFGTKYCRNSPTLDEDKLHRAITAALNEYGAIRAEIKADVLELTELAQSGDEDGGTSLLELRQKLDALTAEQALLLDKILEDMDSPKLNAQLKALAEEKQGILDQIAAHQQDEEQQAIQASRQREMEEWLDQQPMCFTEYDDTLTRRFVERITVVDADTIQVKIRDVDIVINEGIC